MNRDRLKAMHARLKGGKTALQVSREEILEKQEKIYELPPSMTSQEATSKVKFQNQKFYEHIDKVGSHRHHYPND